MEIIDAIESTTTNATLTALAPAMLAFLGVIAANLLSRRSTGRWEIMHLIQWSVDLIAAGGRKADIGIALLDTIAKSGLVSKNDLPFVLSIGIAAETWQERDAEPESNGLSDTITVERG